MVAQIHVTLLPDTLPDKDHTVYIVIYARHGKGTAETGFGA